MDAPRRSRRRRRTAACALTALFFVFSPRGTAQEATPSEAVLSAEDALRRGISLAKMQRWAEAHAVLLSGSRLHPHDARFLVELGAVAFRQNRGGEAAAWLRRALKLAPGDSYAADFLGAIYLLNGNLEAALKYWNRVDRPLVQEIRVEPSLEVDRVMLDRAFAFAPASVMKQSELVESRARLSAMEIFPVFDIRAEARDDGRFDAAFVAKELNGFGRSKTEMLASVLRGVGFQSAHIEYFNMSRATVNWVTQARWDAQKRRLTSVLSGPLGINPRRRYRIGVDLRRENWDLRSSTSDAARHYGSVGFSRSALVSEVAQFAGLGWNWSAGGELSSRDYRNVQVSPQLSPDVFLRGTQLKVVAGGSRALWRLPERRFESRIEATTEAARIWAGPSSSFQRVQTAFSVRWSPQIRGDDYSWRQIAKAGKIFGVSPFDELFLLGMERDTNLWLRAHPGTANGRKGSSPLGRTYFLSNWEVDKAVYSDGLFNVKVGPFLDLGRMGDALNPATSQWMWDTGAQLKVRLLGVGFTLIYGKDLRSGNNTFYVTASR